MNFKRFICVWICLSILLMGCVSAAAETGEASVLPDALTEIRAEAFANVKGMERIIVPDGTERIESRAFADSGLKAIQLPETLTYIADDAFEGCTDLVITVPEGSYAHQWAGFSGFDYEIVGDGEAETEAVYSVADVRIVCETDDSGAETAYASAIVTTLEACALCVDVIGEDGKTVAATYTAEVAGNLDGAQAKAVVSNVLPDYYTLRAVLIDGKGNVLSNTCTNIENSRAYAQFANQTPADFPADQVMDFGETGFAVLSENVIRVPEAAAVSGNAYTFATSEAFKAGDILMLSVDGVDTPVKVGAVSRNSDGTVTIQADEELYLSEVYDKINVSGYASQPANQRSGDPVSIFNNRQSIKWGPVTGSISTSVKLGVTAQYDKKLFGEDYFEISMIVYTDGSGTVTLSEKVSTAGQDNNPLEWQIYNSVVIIPGISAPAFLSVSLPIDINAEAGGTATFGYNNKSGFRFNTTDGFTEIREGTSYARAEVLGKLELKCGPRVSLTGSLFGLISAKLSGQAGGAVVGKLEGLSYGGSTDDNIVDSKHACDACVNIDVKAFGDASASLKYKISKKMSGTLADVKLFEGSKKIGDAFYSIKNDPESIYGGNATGGTGECRNLIYRTDVYTVDMHGEDVSGLPVRVSRSDDVVGSGKSPYRTYLYTGSYTAVAEFDTGVFDAAFTVEDEPCTVTVREEDIPVNLPVLTTGYVRSGTVQALTEGGTCPDGVPEIWLNAVADDWNQLTCVIVEYEGCQPYTFNSEGAAGRMNFFAVPMGDGKYTCVLSLQNAGTVGGCEIVVFRESNGTIEEIKTYLSNKKRTDNIYVSGKFTSDTQFSGVIYPTGNTFTGEFKADGFSRAGKSIYENGLGFMSYEENENGFYDLIFSTSERCYNNLDVVGGSATRYVMKDGAIVIEDQWYESSVADITNK